MVKLYFEKKNLARILQINSLNLQPSSWNQLGSMIFLSKILPKKANAWPNGKYFFSSSICDLFLLTFLIGFKLSILCNVTLDELISASISF